MKTTFKLLLLLFVVLFSNCKKQLEKTKIEGELKEYYTQKPLAGAELILYNNDSNDPHFNSAETVIQKTNTDANGHFSFTSFRAVKRGDYWIELNYGKYTMGTDASTVEQNHIKIDKKEKNYFTAVAIKTCRVKFKMTDTLVYDTNDKLCLALDYSNDNILHSGTGVFYPQCIIGSPVVTDEGAELAANVVFGISWEVTKNNVTNSFNKSVYIINDTLIEIKY